jgi:aryl-alcohol dehydrogenase-like predicted oxidoreductase
MDMRALGSTGLSIPPLVFGGNVFGWTVDEQTSFGLLDALFDHGLTALDTADVYSSWAPGNQGGESETIIGKWLAQNPSRRDGVTIFTKAGWDKGLSAEWIAEAVEASLKRLQTDVIDLYFAHKPDPATPYEETLEAFEHLLKAGKVRAIGGSNLDAGQLADSLAAADGAGLPRYQVLQPEYNLYNRDSFEGPLADLCQAEDIGVVTYFSLASGFLSGKYRSEADLGKSTRGGGMGKYLNPRGLSILDALDEVAASHDATQAEVALAWLMTRPGVTAPIASATTVQQVESLAKSCALKLSPADVEALTAASAA